MSRPKGSKSKKPTYTPPARRTIAFRVVGNEVRAWTNSVFVGDQWDTYTIQDWRLFVLMATSLSAVWFYELDYDEDWVPDNVDCHRIISFIS